jgi:NAD-dependent SIR2 family protein deacetylase
MPDLKRLIAFLNAHERLLVLTGAGMSTASGIPDYRDANGAWKRQQPVQYSDFMGSHTVRQRYWARSLVGWQHMHRAQPNAAHRALVALEQSGRVEKLITQNVDGLHQQAGSRNVIDLHGRIDTVVCMGCRAELPRPVFQAQLNRLNPHWAGRDGESAPDGDADLHETDFGGFAVPDCEHCSGTMKPDVVFFGEAVPKARSEEAMARLASADALLVAGSSLMVFSGFRFARQAAAQGKPVVAVNIGRTRADDLLDFKVPLPCDQALPAAVAAITAGR